LYTAQESNSHYAPQSYTNQSVLKSLLNCASEMPLSRNATGSHFQSASVYATIVRLCVTYYCSVNFYSSSYVLCTILNSCSLSAV